MQAFPHTKFILAGGIDPDNVGDLVKSLRPFGIDASSGLETRHLKDPDRITRFLHNIESAQEITTHTI